MAPHSELTGIVAAIDALLFAHLGTEARALIERYGEALIRAGQVAALERWNATLGIDRAPDTPKALRLQARVLAERNASFRSGTELLRQLAAPFRRILTRLRRTGTEPAARRRRRPSTATGADFNKDIRILFVSRREP